MKRQEIIRNPFEPWQKLLLFLFGFHNLEYFFDTRIYPIYKSLRLFFHMKSLKDPQVKKQVRSIINECARQTRKIEGIIYSKHQKLNKLNSLTVGIFSALLGIVITISGTVFFVIGVKHNFFLIFFSILFIIFGLILTVLVSVLLSVFVFYLHEYSDQNNCYIITQYYIYNISKKWNIWFGKKIEKSWNYSEVQCRWFEMKYIYQAECYFPSSYQFCQMNNIGVVRMYVHHAEYIDEIEAAEQKEKLESTIHNFKSKIKKIPSEFGTKVAPFEIYGVLNPNRIVENINLWSRKLRKEA